jgi:hypothetical protein
MNTFLLIFRIIEIYPDTYMKIENIRNESQAIMLCQLERVAARFEMLDRHFSCEGRSELWYSHVSFRTLSRSLFM